MSIIHDSRVNGPGSRMVIWTQGCNKGCKGCFNPESWNYKINQIYDPLSLANVVKEANPEGLTLSGGDPLEQPDALLEFLTSLHEADKSLFVLPKGIILFTGYTWQEINGIGGSTMECVQLCDLVIDGRYIKSQKISDRIAGSANQEFHFLPKSGRGRDRIGEFEVITDQGVEIHLDNNNIQITGFPPVSPKAKKMLRDLGLVKTKL